MSLLRGLHGHMVHTPADVVLLTSVALWHLVVIPGLQLLRCLPLSAVVELAWSLMSTTLGTIIGVVANLTTFEACDTSSGNRGIVSHRCLGGSVLMILR